MYLIFDTETTGLPKKWKAPITDTDNWPRCIQIAWQLHDELGQLIESQDYLVQTDGFNIPYDAEQIHGISTQLADEKGIVLAEVLEKFNEALAKTKFVVGQNVGFDLNIMGCEFYRLGLETNLNSLPILDTCTEKTATLCQIPGGRGGKFKLPTLTELHQHLFGIGFGEAHNATADVEATTRCFLELVRKRNYTLEQLDVAPDFFEKFDAKNPQEIQLIGLKHINLKKESKKLKEKAAKKIDWTGSTKISSAKEKTDLKNVAFAHLHNHSQFSILQSTASISDLVEATIKQNMPAVALTDAGNMMGAFYFVKEILAYNKTVLSDNENLKDGQEPKKEITPIVGSQFNVCEDHLDRSHKDNGYQIVLLAKNKNGYHHLAKLSSISHTNGFYYVPRIDKNLIEQYKDDLIVLSGNIYGEISSKILNIGEKQAEEALVWWKEKFKDDFYLEITNHGQENEKHVNEVIINFSKKHQVKLIATNDTFYINQSDATPHDILLCVKDGEKFDTPKGRGRGFRYGLPNEEYYFKSADEMAELFQNIPEAIINIKEVIDKIETYALAREVLLPKFDIPKEFINPEDAIDGGVRGENAYLKHLTFEGAKKRYGELDKETIERLDFELSIIKMTGYPGYFLIVWDLILEARKMDVSVGPGRGSAAGSVVAYCLWITNIDPIKYDLLFERFLNPDRVSLPDIDIDFDDEGRQRVIDFVIKKYGSNNVAQIITYGTMAAKSSIRDTARVLDLPLPDADRIAKLIPNTKLNYIFGDDKKSKSKIAELRSEDKDKIGELLTISDGKDLAAKTISQALALEGSVRNTGTHACGIIITPEDITNLVPVATAKDSNMFVTQFDNNVVESAGLLKMDFLGLKTLSLIKDTVKIVKGLHGKELIPDDFPLDDEKTYKLFQRGETIGIFQYESPGMQKHMKDLKPTVFADLIAMNALYRPGPMEYIPLFIMRKHGREAIEYDLPEMEEYLKETYGITVYQEQVMRLSQKLANFTKGEADLLRKAMGKKLFALLEKLKPKFMEGGKSNGHPEDILEKIWKDWEAFAAYAFNKSHSTCYAYIAYQTAYLKAHYPAEYMAAVLSNNMRDIKQVSFFMEECKRANIAVLGPDVNESYYKFSVNKDGAIRFGMGAIKGVGENAVASIINERKENGNFKSIFDVAKRIDLRAANKRTFEGMVFAGGYDSFNSHRAQYFALDEKGLTFLEKTIRYGSKYQENKNSSQVSLFGETSEVQFPEPIIPECEEWGMMEKLSKEKEVVGIYISGHPLDDFKSELESFCNANLLDFADAQNLLNADVSIGGIVTSVEHRISKNGKGWASFFIEDFKTSHEFRLFGEDYLKFKHFLVPNSFLFMRISGRKNYYNDDVRLQFTEIQLLQEIMEKLSKKVTIHLKIDELDNNKLKVISNILETNKGTKPIHFTIIDNKEKVKLNMSSRTQKIAISNELLSVLKKEALNFKLN